MAETGVQFLRRLTEQRRAAAMAATAELAEVLADLEDDGPITWLCDLGDHDGCDGYACGCCARGHQLAGGGTDG